MKSIFKLSSKLENRILSLIHFSIVIFHFFLWLSYSKTHILGVWQIIACRAYKTNIRKSLSKVEIRHIMVALLITAYVVSPILPPNALYFPLWWYWHKHCLTGYGSRFRLKNNLGGRGVFPLIHFTIHLHKCLNELKEASSAGHKNVVWKENCLSQLSLLPKTVETFI